LTIVCADSSRRNFSRQSHLTSFDQQRLPHTSGCEAVVQLPTRSDTNDQGGRLIARPISQGNAGLPWRQRHHAITRHPNSLHAIFDFIYCTVGPIKAREQRAKNGVVEPLVRYQGALRPSPTFPGSTHRPASTFIYANYASGAHSALHPKQEWKTDQMLEVDDLRPLAGQR
jgi:hypothetical protein